ncbi:MAG: hypothetical protein QNJ72_43480 [Pleurocapsa sp. MO_226.B13]|nr:hypothetical protein [Pleurocapsa sp. MO_226.B13]
MTVSETKLNSLPEPPGGIRSLAVIVFLRAGIFKIKLPKLIRTKKSIPKAIASIPIDLPPIAR